MSRAALRAARPGETPAQPEPERRVYCDIPQPLMDAETTGKFLGNISAAQVDKLRQCAGLPAVDLGVSNPTRRKKGLYKYDPEAVRDWWRHRQGGGVP